MENASKALIMAGAVLVAIILITMGVMLLSNQKSLVDTSKEAADTVAIKTFNSTFEKYKGTKKGTEINQLYSDRNISNKRNPSHQVNITTTITNFLPNQNYKVTINESDYDSNGYVMNVNIATAP